MMKAVLHTEASPAWLTEGPERSWALLPLGNRPLLEYWLEACVALGIREVRLVLGAAAEAVEHYAGDGSRWGIEIRYGFLKEGQAPERFVRRSPAAWADGLLLVTGACFPRRTGADAGGLAAGTTVCWSERDPGLGFASADPEALKVFLDGGAPPQGPEADGLGFQVVPVDSAETYYRLNMALVNGEITRYLAPGYSKEEGAYVGYNVVIPPSCRMSAPVMVGNDCRFAPLSVVGPGAVIGSHVVVDTQAELKDCVVLDGTYIGRNVDITGKIVAGNVLIDPESGFSVALEDPLLLDATGSTRRIGEFLLTLTGKIPALLLWLLQLPWFVVLGGLLVLTGRRRFRIKSFLDVRNRPLKLPVLEGDAPCALAGLFQALSLDRFPALCWVLLFRLHLCGHAPIAAEGSEALRKRLPRTCPAAFYEELLLPQPVPETILEIYALHYVAARSLSTDLSLLGRVLLGRLLSRCTLSAAEEAHA